MGRTTNTNKGISKDRAHVHFELNLFANEHFSKWFKASSPGERKRPWRVERPEFMGIDPRQVLVEEQKRGANFRLLDLIRNQPELCPRGSSRKTDFPWLAPLCGVHYGLFARRTERGSGGV